MKTLHRLIRLHNLRMRKWAVKWHVINCEMLKLLRLLRQKRFYNLTFSARMRRIITRLNSVHRICCEEFVLEEKKQWNSNESTESILENLLCTISAPKKTVLQRKQRATYVTHAISVFYWRLTGWNLNALILFGFIVLPAHPTLYRVSLRASQPFDGIDHVFFCCFFFCPS